ncbi:ROK family protein [Actinomyces culturomici]|uniref:ROK family protein n=1 Tax=Actinomyces culturomici TaxID=1926276 RepID=UPI000E207F8E|nr:ROK family protein [Actinomyces culturomici]
MEDPLTPQRTLEIHRRILDLVRSGRASTRNDLVELLPASPSTVSLRTRELIDSGELVDSGAAPSTGGRPSHVLRPATAETLILGADLGTQHARIGIAKGDGTVLAVRQIVIDATQSPQDVLDLVFSAFDSLLKAQGGACSPAAICIGLPAPIDHAHGWVDTGSRLRGWHHFPVADEVRRRYGSRVAIENDADLMAIGEHRAHPGIAHSITVKAGTSIGVGVIIDSRVHRGATGAAGDISHVRMPAFGNLTCACGKTGCLDTVVSGHALANQWQAIAGESRTFADLLAAAANGDARAIELLRTAGSRLGEALSAIAGLLNPDAIFIGGLLSTSEDFLAAIRAVLYASCHPLITRRLLIEATSTGHDAGLRGALAVAKSLLD